MQLSIAKALVAVGLVCLLVGSLLWFAPKLPWLGKLPGDIQFRGERFSFYFPVVTCLVVSILLTLLLNFFLRR